MHRFSFETLDVYQLSRSVARWMRTAPWPRNARHIQDQAIRAADSVVLNLAEGLSRGGRPGTNHLRIAMGSAGEAFAALDLVDMAGAVERREELRRIAAMLSKIRVR
jgi:four helix bundle protein